MARGNLLASLALVAHTTAVTLHKSQLNGRMWRPKMNSHFVRRSEAQAQPKSPCELVWSKGVFLCAPLIRDCPYSFIGSCGTHPYPTTLRERGSWTIHISARAEPRRSGERWGGSTNVCFGCSNSVPLCPFHQADQELLWGSSGLQNKGKKEGFTDLRIYGFEGEPGGRRA